MVLERIGGGVHRDHDYHPGWSLPLPLPAGTAGGPGEEQGPQMSGWVHLYPGRYCRSAANISRVIFRISAGLKTAAVSGSSISA